MLSIIIQHFPFLFLFNSYESINHLKRSKLYQWKVSLRHDYNLFSSLFCSAEMWPCRSKNTCCQIQDQIWKSSGGCLPLCELQENLLNHVMGIYMSHCLDFILCVCHTSSPDRIHLVLYPDSFSAAWQPPSLAWITHRTRVERTVSFCVCVRVCV